MRFLDCATRRRRWWRLRLAAQASKDAETYRTGLRAITAMSNLVGAALTPHLKLLIGQLAKNANKKGWTEQVADALGTLEGNGGEACYKMIKAKIPTYCSQSLGAIAGGLSIAGAGSRAPGRG